MRITVLDYGAGNLHSLAKALERAGAAVDIQADPLALLEGDAMVLPGVGAFGPAAACLRPALDRVRDALRGGLPCLGICLGMQLLLEGSDESDGDGVGIVPGRVRRIEARRIPHMGWNAVTARAWDPLLTGVEPLVAYFANSFAAHPMDPEHVLATADYGDRTLVAAIRRGRAWGVQFHPEKSGVPGLRLLSNFVAAAR